MSKTTSAPPSAADLRLYLLGDVPALTPCLPRPGWLRTNRTSDLLVRAPFLRQLVQQREQLDGSPAMTLAVVLRYAAILAAADTETQSLLLSASGSETDLFTLFPSQWGNNAGMTCNTIAAERIAVYSLLASMFVTGAAVAASPASLERAAQALLLAANVLTTRATPRWHLSMQALSASDFKSRGQHYRFIDLQALVLTKRSAPGARPGEWIPLALALLDLVRPLPKGEYFEKAWRLAEHVWLVDVMLVLGADACAAATADNDASVARAVRSLLLIARLCRVGRDLPRATMHGAGAYDNWFIEAFQCALDAYDALRERFEQTYVSTQDENAGRLLQLLPTDLLACNQGDTAPLQLGGVCLRAEDVAVAGDLFAPYSGAGAHAATAAKSFFGLDTTGLIRLMTTDADEWRLRGAHNIAATLGHVHSFLTAAPSSGESDTDAGDASTLLLLAPKPPTTVREERWLLLGTLGERLRWLTYLRAQPQAPAPVPTFYESEWTDTQTLYQQVSHDLGLDPISHK